MNAVFLFGAVISLLLSVVAFFTKQMHGDFKKVEKDLSEVKTTTTLIKAEFKGINELLNQKIDFIEKRIAHIESIVFKNRKCEFD